MVSDVIIRPYRESDSLKAITELLHEAYRPLAEMGLRFVATYQDETETAHRIAKGRCLIAEHESKIVGTVTYMPKASSSISCFYQQPGIASFGQFAVRPDVQKLGIGTRLLSEVEIAVRAAGARELALDTSEQALHLIEYYERKGFRFVEYVQWDRVNYRSVIMAKRLT